MLSLAELLIFFATVYFLVSFLGKKYGDKLEEKLNKLFKNK